MTTFLPFLLALAVPAAAAAAAEPLAPSAAVVRAADDFSRVAEAANPWVVNISTTQYVKTRVNPFWQQFYGFDPFGGGRTYKRQSLGSGFILSADGEVLTNAHVVEGADEVMVRTEDGEEHPAEVLGQDASVDLALLKIKPKKPLPTAVLGDSSKVKVGEWAIAIGNPFGFDHSLTVGVISATGRMNIFSGEGAARYQNYLQTDASINHGNSGGPLCNIRGEVIGVNTAISTPNEGSIGIGFAIPINFVKRSVPDLRSAGKVVAPRLGFYTQDVDRRLAKALKLPSPKGVLVTDVAAGGAAEKAGLRRGDVILALGGREVGSTPELRTLVYEAEPSKAIIVVVWREGKREGLQILPGHLAQAGPLAWHGLEVKGNSASLARERGLAVAEGVVVERVAQGSAAERIGVKRDDVIVEVNQARVAGLEDWKKLQRGLDESQDAVVLLVRGRQSAYVVLPGEK